MQTQFVTLIHKVPLNEVPMNNYYNKHSLALHQS